MLPEWRALRLHRAPAQLPISPRAAAAAARAGAPGGPAAPSSRVPGKRRRRPRPEDTRC